MQTLIHQNETLEKDIKELRKQLQELKEQSVKPKNYTRKKSIFGQRTLGRKKKGKKLDFDTGEKSDGRPAKVLQTINQVHDLVLAGNFNAANRVVYENKKKLFPPKTVKGQMKAFDLKDGFGETVLMKAVRQGKTQIVEQLLQMNLTCDVQDNEGETALMMASKYGKESLVRLLAPRANKDTKTLFTKKTALMMAAEGGFAEICAELIENGADPLIENLDGQTALDLAKDKKTHKVINKAVKRLEGGMDDDEIDEDMDSEDEEELAMLGLTQYDEFEQQKKRNFENDERMKPYLEKNEELQKEKDQLEIELQNLKTKAGPVDQWAKVKTMTQAERQQLLNADTRSKKEVNEILRFHDLILSGDDSDSIEEVEKILTGKKTKTVRDKADAFGETGLMKAARLGYEEMLDLLLEYKADYDMRDNNGYSAVMKAAEFGKSATLLKLAEAGANLNFATRRDKFTALMLAAKRGHGEVCKELIEEGADYNLLDSTGKKAVDMIRNTDAKKVFEQAVVDNPMSAFQPQI